MKQITLSICVLIFLTGCKEKQNLNKDIPEHDFSWLNQQWVRTNNPEGTKTFETWYKQSDKLFKGHSCTIKGQDTVWQEKVNLLKKDTSWIYEVHDVGSPRVTPFVLTSMGKNTFTCENEANEFPKKISYTYLPDTLFAKISGGGPDIVFKFVRK